MVYFFDWRGIFFGSKETLANPPAKIMGIDVGYYPTRSTRHWHSYISVSCRMSQASKRQTTLKEDIAYCLLGLCDINIPLLHGEGAAAF